MLDRLLKPRFPSSAVGIKTGAASVVQLERSRGSFVIKRAATINLPANVVRSSFDESNVLDPSGLAAALADLATSAGLLRQKKWSVTLPEASARATIVTLETTGGSRREIEEVLEWKIERTFGAPLNELRIGREELPANEQKQVRYLITAVRSDVLAEYEAVFAAMGWHTGLMVPRHVGEEQWLTNGSGGDGLLLSAHEEGFTAVLLRNNRPLTLRTVVCDTEECDDELHRLLLFYRDRAGSNGAATSVSRLLVTGDLLNKQRVAEIAEQTLGVNLQPLTPHEIGLTIPGDLPFDLIAAPAGLARLAW
jgi:Tfp pilus assembly PilM family ATPase